MRATRPWTYYLGLALFIFSFVAYGVVALLPFLHLATMTAATVATVLIVAAELSFFSSVALLGKPFLQTLKEKWCALWRRAPRAPAPIGKTRHYVGVAMMLLSLLPYLAAEVMLIAGYAKPLHLTTVIGFLLGGDALFVSALFVLGADFWERLKKLFEWPRKSDRP